MRTLNNGIKLFSSQLFDESVIHGFLTRHGGVSGHPYESLNFDARDADPKENVEENRKRFFEAFGVKRLFTVSQAHGSAVFKYEGVAPPSHPEADAIITNMPGVAIGMLTADCLPVLIHDPVNRAIGAVHAGWKGTALGIVINTVKEMGRVYGSKPRDLIAALGPAIGPCCYKVGENLMEEFLNNWRGLESFLMLEDGLRLDLGAENLSQLLSIGVPQKNISGSAPCTSCSMDFFSYRRDSGRTGRQLSFIMLKERP